MFRAPRRGRATGDAAGRLVPRVRGNRDGASATRTRPAAVPEPSPSGPPPLDLVVFTVIVDDLVFADGSTRMGVLGGGGPQTAFGFRTHPGNFSVGLAAGIGPVSRAVRGLARRERRRQRGPDARARRRHGYVRRGRAGRRRRRGVSLRVRRAPRTEEARRKGRSRRADVSAGRRGRGRSPSATAGARRCGARPRTRVCTPCSAPRGDAPAEIQRRAGVPRRRKPRTPGRGAPRVSAADSRRRRRGTRSVESSSMAQRRAVHARDAPGSAGNARGAVLRRKRLLPERAGGCVPGG